MPLSVTDFLAQLASDSEKLANFLKHPDATLSAAGVSGTDHSDAKRGAVVSIHERLTPNESIIWGANAEPRIIWGPTDCGAKIIW